RYRWLIAGGTQQPFSPEAIGIIRQKSRGVPRVINSLCDNALTSAFGEGTTQVAASHVLAAARDMKIGDAHEETPLEERFEPAPVDLPTLEVYNGSPGESLWTKWAQKLRGQRGMKISGGNTEQSPGIEGA